MPTAIQQFELERIVNMLKSFGWSVITTKYDGDRIEATFEKIVKAEVPK
jgi:transketolase N-terminal domain/subunit